MNFQLIKGAEVEHASSGCIPSYWITRALIKRKPVVRFRKMVVSLSSQ